jgi:hypothetical protein
VGPALRPLSEGMTDYIKNHENGWKRAATALHDTLPTVLKAYAFLKADDHFKYVRAYDAEVSREWAESQKPNQKSQQKHNGGDEKNKGANAEDREGLIKGLASSLGIAIGELKRRILEAN